MTTTGAPGLSARAGLFVAGLFVVVAGILGMHGLALHGGSGVDHAHMLDPMAAQVTQAPPLLDVPTPLSQDAMAAMCLAVLSAVALALTLAAQRRTGRDPRPAKQTCSRATAGRGREPPSLSLLSVQRC